jgi:uncharacterized membrane protein
MNAWLGLLKSTVIGGVVFLLPIGIIAIVLGKLLSYARRIGDVLHAQLFPRAESDLVPMLIALLLLVGLAFVAGAVARTRFGLRVFAWLERAVLANFPAYTVLRQTVSDVAGGSLQITDAAEAKVVLVRFDDVSVLGFLVDRRADGSGIVYMPGAPSALSGSVALVAADRITETQLKPTDVVQGMRRLGAGLAAFDRR